MKEQRQLHMPGCGPASTGTAGNSLCTLGGAMPTMAAALMYGSRMRRRERRIK